VCTFPLLLEEVEKRLKEKERNVNFLLIFYEGLV